MIFIFVVALSITSAMSKHQHRASEKAGAAPVEQAPGKAATPNLGTAENPIALDEVVYSAERH